MKRYIFTALAIVAIASCTKGLEQGIESGITGDVAPFAYDDATRTNLVYNQTGLDFTWSANDKVAVFGPGGEQQLMMKINVKEGEAVRTATFTITQAYSLEKGSDYVAYCPMVNDMLLTADAVDFSYPAVQEQETNAITSTSHLGQYDFMVSDLTPATAENKAAFTFRHKCTPVYINLLNMPGGNYKSVSLVADSDVFTTKGTFDVFNNTSKSTELTNTLKINYKSAVAVAEKGTMHAWIMMAPVDLTGKSVKVVATTEAGGTVELNVEAKYLKNFVAGSAYRIVVEKAEKIEEVDLKLPSGTEWANMNLGAKAYYEYGDYYAWGEISPKTEYTKANYKFYLNGKSTNGNVTKYNEVDGKKLLDPEDDAATVALGPDWCIPTLEQWKEMVAGCTWSEEIINGYEVYVATGSNGAKIYFPQNGNYTQAGLQEKNDISMCWTSETGNSQNTQCYRMKVSTTASGKIEFHTTSGSTRWWGLGIRPVKRKK